MSLQEFQQALVDLTLAPQVSSRLAQGDTSILDSYHLEPRERARLLAVVRQPGMSVNCTVARGNRFDAIGEIFPMTCVLLEPVLRKVLDELWGEHRPTNYQFAGEEEAFADFLRRQISEGSIDIKYLSEVFAYESLCWELAQQLRFQTDPDQESFGVIEFHYPPDQLLEPLSRLTAPPPDLPLGTYRARVNLRHNRFGVELLPNT